MSKQINIDFAKDNLELRARLTVRYGYEIANWTDRPSHKMFGARHKQIRDKRTVTPLNGITLEI